MLKKISLFMLLILGMFIVVPNVNAAACDYKEQNRLNSLGVNVKVDYVVEKREKIEIITTDDEKQEEYTFYYTYFTINIFNVTDELRVAVRNVTKGVVVNYYYSDVKDGVISFIENDSDSTTEYSISVYSTNTDTCDDILLAVKTLRLPRTNRYSKYEVCKDAVGFSLCNEFLNSDYYIDEISFFKQYQQYLNKTGNTDNTDTGDNVGFWSKTFDFIGKYWYYFASVVIIVGTGVGVIVATRIRRRDI